MASKSRDLKADERTQRQESNSKKNPIIGCFLPPLREPYGSVLSFSIRLEHRALIHLPEESLLYLNMHFLGKLTVNEERACCGQVQQRNTNNTKHEIAFRFLPDFFWQFCNFLEIF